MSRRVLLLVLAAVVAPLALLRDGKDEPPAWTPDALAVADDLAAGLRAAGLACDEYAVYDFDAIARSYRGRLPLPAAMTECTTDGDEHLELAIFPDGSDAREFVAAKRRIICERAAARGFGRFPGFAYVDGGRWIIQPDERGTASRLAAALGAQHRQAGCAHSPSAAAAAGTPGRPRAAR